MTFQDRASQSPFAHMLRTVARIAIDLHASARFSVNSYGVLVTRAKLVRLWCLKVRD